MRIGLVSLVIVIMSSRGAFADDALKPAQRWNEFRGPGGAGVAPNCQPPIDIRADRATWRVSVPPGHSSPVLSREFVFLTGVDGGRLVTFALRQSTGARVWQHAAPEVSLEAVHEASSPAAATPYVDDERLYVYFGSYGLLCYDHSGQELWQRSIPAPESLYGTSTSPIVHGDQVILVLDNDANLPESELSQSRIVAINKWTGELSWETARPFHRSGWSTPTIWTHSTGQELVVLGNGRVCSYDLETGAEKWFVNGFSRETIARPIVGHDRVFVSASMLGGVADDQPDPEPFWNAVMRFDVNRDERLERAEMTGPFTFPFRPHLPSDHPGFGVPLPDDPARRKSRLDGMFQGIDRDQDGFWAKQEFLDGLKFDRGKPNLMAIRPGGVGDITESHVEWALHRGIPEIPSPVFDQGYLYLVCDGGILSAVNAADGQVFYRERLGTTGQYAASPVIANQHLYTISEAGILSVVRVGEQFQRVQQHDFEARVVATPAIDEATIYIRTEKELWAFRNERPAAP